MKWIYITGTSSGIGRELANLFLQQEDVQVIGMSRRNMIKHERYRHEVLDLADADAVARFEFFVPANIEEVILINNAGWLGEVGISGSLDPADIAKVYQINAASPMILMNNLLKALPEKCEAQILNISSGVSQYPVKGWSNYCASKAALDMASKVVKIEHPNIKVYAIAPGIVDTPMQGEIRETKTENFPDQSRFVEYFENKQLTHPLEVAKQLIDILRGKLIAPGVVCSLNDF